jgi:GNAT superfamily N-acetyltransferase
MTNGPIEVRQTTLADLDLVVPLFDAYRQFYHRPSDPESARRFLSDRLERSQSVILLALADGQPIGFSQLYPSFSSASMAPIFILNDLFVAPEARRSGAGAALLEAAADYARRSGATRMTLSTEVTNTTAQELYERRGWKRDTIFYVYQLNL